MFFTLGKLVVTQNSKKKTQQCNRRESNTLEEKNDFRYGEKRKAQTDIPA